MSFSVRVLAALMALGITASATSAAVVIQTTDGQGADTFVQSTSNNTAPFANFGGSTNLTVKNGGAADQFARKAYLRFDLAALGALDAVSATLNLTVAVNNIGSGNLNPTSFTVQVLGLIDGFAGADNSSPADGDVDDDEDLHDEFWPEDVIDWDSAPANNTGSGSAFDSNAMVLGSFSVSSSDVDGSTVSFSNTALTNFINADTNGVITLMLRRSGGNAGGTNNLAFRSKEFDDGVGDPTAPTLTITPVPEPGTLALLGAGTLALIRRRR